MSMADVRTEGARRAGKRMFLRLELRNASLTNMMCSLLETGGPNNSADVVFYTTEGHFFPPPNAAKAPP
jgi:hypothetical protein